MKAVIAPPFRTADPGRLKCGPWMRPLEPQIELAETISGLDYTSILNVQRELSIDIEGLRTDCRLPADAQLTVSVSWTAGGTHLRRTLYRSELPVGSLSVELVIGGAVPAEAASGRLTLDTKISLSAAVSGGNPMAATRPGSVVWMDSQTVSLDGSTSFFPVQLANFSDKSAAWTQPDAAWCLLWSPLEMERPFLGSVKLLINSSHARVAQAVSGPPRNKEAQAIRSAIYFDVARSLILGALNNSEFITRDGEYPVESCGKAVNDLIRNHFPEDKLPALRDTASSAPELFSADLQSKLKLFWSID